MAADHKVGAVIHQRRSGLGRPLGVRRKLLEVLFDGRPQADADVAALAKTYFDQLAAERKLLTVPAVAADAAKLAAHYVNDALGDITVRPSGGSTVFDFGEWDSEVASRHNPDGTVSFLTVAPGIVGLEFVVGPGPNPRSPTATRSTSTCSLRAAALPRPCDEGRATGVVDATRMVVGSGHGPDGHRAHRHGAHRHAPTRPTREATAGWRSPPPLALAEFEPKSMLHVQETHVARARFPVIDFHTHVSPRPGSQRPAVPPRELLRAMDAVNVQTMVNLTGGSGEGLRPRSRTSTGRSRAGS